MGQQARARGRQRRPPPAPRTFLSRVFGPGGSGPRFVTGGGPPASAGRWPRRLSRETRGEQSCFAREKVPSAALPRLAVRAPGTARPIDAIALPLRWWRDRSAIPRDVGRHGRLERFRWRLTYW